MSVERNETTNWNDFFEARIADQSARREALVNQGTYVEKIVTTSTLNEVLEMYVDSNGRKRVELSPVFVDGVHIGDRIGIITDYGNYGQGAKEPAGHTYSKNVERWQDESLSQRLIEIGDSDSSEWETLEITESNKGGQSFKREIRNVDGGSVIRHTTLTGNGHGRIWAVYTPNDPKTIPFEFVNGETSQIGFDLSYGITIQQGDVSDKKRSDRGATHYAITGMSILE